MQCLVSQPTVALSPSILSCTSDSSLVQKLYKLLRGLFSLKHSISIIRQAVFGESAHYGSELFNFLLCKPDSSANLGTEALQITVNYVPSIFQIREIEFSPFLHFPPLQPPPPFPLWLVQCSLKGSISIIRQAPPANDPILPISLVDGFLQVCYKSHTALYKMTPTALFWVILSTMLLFVKWGTNWFSSLATSLSNHLLDS